MNANRARARMKLNTKMMSRNVDFRSAQITIKSENVSNLLQAKDFQSISVNGQIHLLCQIIILSIVWNI